jgi:ubiquitin carboxyl-terminal hydrolase 1
MESSDYLKPGSPAGGGLPNMSFQPDHFSPDFRSTALQTVVLATVVGWLLANVVFSWRPPAPLLWHLYARLKTILLYADRIMAHAPAGLFNAFEFLNGAVARGELSAVPFGIFNPSLGCYQNSVVQALASLGSLDEYVRFAALGGDTSSALADALVALNSDHPRSRADIHLPPVLRRQMSVWQEQDAQEFYSVLTEALAKEHDAAQERVLARAWSLPGTTPPPPPKNPLEGTIAQRLLCTRCGHHDPVRHEPFTSISLSTSRPHEAPPAGRVRVTRGTTLRACLGDFTAPELIDGVDCRRCTVLRHARRLAESFAKLRGRGSPRLRRARARRLARVRRAVLAGDVSDAALRAIGLAKRPLLRSAKLKQLVVGVAPAALVLHVNRSVFDARRGTQSKDTRRVAIPPVLDLAPWMVADEGGGAAPAPAPGRADMRPSSPADPARPSPYTYALRALVDHKGTHGGGHYVCYRQCAPSPARLPSSSSLDSTTVHDEKRTLRFPGWFLCDDGAVRAVGEAEAVAGTAHGEPFLLLYERLAEEERVLVGAASTPVPESDDEEEGEKGGEEEAEGGVVPVVVQREECAAVVRVEMREAGRGRGPKRRRV